MKNYWATWNKDGEKNLQVVVVSGDQNEEGFKSTMEGVPFVALPFGADKTEIEKKIPCTGYPTPGVLKADGTVVDSDAFGKVNEGSFATWNI